jgi:hypothetical protein
MFRRVYCALGGVRLRQAGGCHIDGGAGGAGGRGRGQGDRRGKSGLSNDRKRSLGDRLP